VREQNLKSKTHQNAANFFFFFFQKNRTQHTQVKRTLLFTFMHTERHAYETEHRTRNPAECCLWFVYTGSLLVHVLSLYKVCC